MTEPAPPAGSARSLLVVAGSGRSGTSLVAGLVGRLGVYIPQPELKANDTNPRGFGEPKWAVAFHKDLLHAVDVTHDDGRPQAWNRTARLEERPAVVDRLRGWLDEQFAGSDRVVVKDPRLGWFLGLYQIAAANLGAELKVVTMLRHPAETIRSKELAYGSRVESTTRTAGWLNMMLGTELATRAMPRAVIRYDDLLSSWKPTLGSADEQLSMQLLGRASPEQLADADGLVDPTLRRTDRDWTELSLPAPLQDLAEQTFQALTELAVVPGAAPATTKTDRIDELRESFASHYADAEALVKSTLNGVRSAERRKGQRQVKAQLQQARQDGRQQAARSAPSRGTSTPAPPTTRSTWRRVASGARRRAMALRSGR